MLKRILEAFKMLSNVGFLSSGRFRSFFLYVKEPLEELMYGSMLRRPWFLALGASPFYLVMMPMFSFVLICLAAVDVYELIKAKDKNLDLWLNAIVGSLCASLATTSIALLEISLLTGTTFAIGPWIFLSSVVVFSANALFQTGLNLWRACHSPSGSQKQLNFIQSTINWAFILATVTAVIGCVVFVILFPEISATAGVACAATAVTLTTASLLWRMTPSVIKSNIKQRFGLEIDPDCEIDEIQHTHQRLSPNLSALHLNPRLETAPDDSRLSWVYTSARSPNLVVNSDPTESPIMTLVAGQPS